MEALTANDRLRVPPDYCEYTSGPCDQAFEGTSLNDAFFLYASDPTEISGTIEVAVQRLRDSQGTSRWGAWRDLPIFGQLIFCEICKAARFSSTIIADVTTLNFNLMFEIGFAIGLGLPVVPIRDASFGVDREDFEALGILDTLGYLDFSDAQALADGVMGKLPSHPLPELRGKDFTETPLYVLRGNRPTEGTSQLEATLKKAALKYRAFDPIETPRLSLFEARRQVGGSVGVLANLHSLGRDGSRVHNARCALICGMAMAQEKVVVMIQEGSVAQPIDYRDVVRTYSDPRDVPAVVRSAFPSIVESLQRAARPTGQAPVGLLEKIDLGDTAAENEITRLPFYFVRTGQYRQALQGNARLVVGRKGAGKTALFYEVREAIGISRASVVLDLKPEGHQFTKLREAVLDQLRPGVREHAITAFWNYILLVELAHTVVTHERRFAERDGDRWEKFRRLEEVYREHAVEDAQDLSQRLLRQIDRIAVRFEGGISDGGITEAIYGGDIRALDDAVSEYLGDKDAVWLLFDNLDKGWPTRGTDVVDILVLRGLLEATRKLQRQLEQRGIDFRCLVFIRTDVYEHLLLETPDKGKDTAIRLDWDDPMVFEDIVRRRIEASTTLTGDFRAVWREIADSHVDTQDSFNYIVDRTLMRPRDLLTFVQRAIEVSLNRGHSKVNIEDIGKAEESYSEDMLLSVDFEIRDTDPDFADLLYAFIDAPAYLKPDEVRAALKAFRLEDEKIDRARDLLLWFGFLGVEGAEGEGDRFAHQVRYNLKLLLAPVGTRGARLVIHPAFRRALQIEDQAQLAIEDGPGT